MEPRKDYREEVDRRIGQAVRNTLEKEIEAEEGISMDEFRMLVGEPIKPAKKVKKNHYTGLVAAAVVLLCVLTVLQFVLPMEEIFAGPSPDQDVTVEDGIIIIGSDENDNSKTWVSEFSSYEDVPDELKDKLLVFEYIPQDYQLEDIEMRRNSSGFISNLNYSSERGNLRVELFQIEGPNESKVLLNQYKLLEESSLQIYGRVWQDIQYYAFVKDKFFIVFEHKGSIEVKEIEAMVASIRMF